MELLQQFTQAKVLGKVQGNISQVLKKFQEKMLKTHRENRRYLISLFIRLSFRVPSSI